MRLKRDNDDRCPWVVEEGDEFCDTIPVAGKLVGNNNAFPSRPYIYEHTDSDTRESFCHTCHIAILMLKLKQGRMDE